MRFNWPALKSTPSVNLGLTWVSPALPGRVRLNVEPGLTLDIGNTTHEQEHPTLSVYSVTAISFVPETPGLIRTALMNMDREAKEYYEVIIQAKDMGGQLGGLAGTTTVNISLSDVNDNPPRFPQSEYPLRQDGHRGVAERYGCRRLS